MANSKSSFSEAAKSTMGWGAFFAILVELTAHIAVHYTVPGANAASWLAQTLAPALDSIGLTTVFSASATGTTITSAAPLPALNTL